MKIVVAQKEEIDKLSGILTESMSLDPMCLYTFGDVEQHHRYCRGFWKASLEYAFRFGTVLATEDGSGCLSLVHPGHSDFTFAELLATGFGVPLSILRFPYRQMRIALDVFPRLATLQHEILPDPHWYVLTLGVIPEEQGKGIGKGLLDRMLRIVEAAKNPVYLETETEKNVALYKKYGFEVARKIVFEKYGLDYYLMVRK
ncbi:MAG: N-acetyltransferase [Spirochaetales bacterium]|nr:MAG: N-acetyltransferase [Spirochaetales bacterium]